MSDLLSAIGDSLGTQGVDYLDGQNSVVNRWEVFAGDDQLNGGEKNDSADGGLGKNSLYGDAGSDTIDGGVGDDVLNGGEGADVYVFKAGDGSDTIAEADPSRSSIDQLDF